MLFEKINDRFLFKNTLLRNNYYKNEVFTRTKNTENMYKVMGFCHLQENLEINTVKNSWILRQKQE